MNSDIIEVYVGPVFICPIGALCDGVLPVYQVE
jgi:hypothetical protein